MAIYEDPAQTEFAEHTGMPPVTVRSNARRACAGRTE